MFRRVDEYCQSSSLHNHYGVANSKRRIIINKINITTFIPRKQKRSLSCIILHIGHVIVGNFGIHIWVYFGYFIVIDRGVVIL